MESDASGEAVVDGQLTRVHPVTGLEDAMEVDRIAAEHLLSHVEDFDSLEFCPLRISQDLQWARAGNQR